MAEKVVIGNAELWHGDCRDVLPLLPACDLLLTDPPYGIGINKSHRLATSRGHGGESWDDKPVPHWLMLMMQEQAAEAIVWGGNYYTMGPARCVLVWDKMQCSDKHADTELIWTSFDRNAKLYRYCFSGNRYGWEGNIKGVGRASNREHPTQKPSELMAAILRDYGQNAATVLDPFMGSGTTGVACAQLGKAFTGIERERKYFDIACERISRAQAQGSLLPLEQTPVATQQVMEL